MATAIQRVSLPLTLANISISIETSAKLSIFSRELSVRGDKCSVASLGDM